MNTDSQRRSPDPYVAAVRVWRTADADARHIAMRMQYAARAVAAERFAEIWPESSRNKTTRRQLQGWYLHVFEGQLSHGVTAPSDSPIDGSEAERVMAVVRQRTKAEPQTVRDVVITLARDSRALAHSTNRGRARFIEAGLRGHISRLYRPAQGSEVGSRQAILEQWYARAFRAQIDSFLFGIPTPPVTPGEVHAIGVCLGNGQPRQLYAGGEPIGPARQQNWREHAAWNWVNLSLEQREAWLSRHRFNNGLAMTSFGNLPAVAQADLLQEYPPTQLVLDETNVVSGRPREAAAQAFDTTPIARASKADRDTERMLYSRGGVTIPRDFISQHPDINPVVQALNNLAEQNQGRREMAGLGDRSAWWLDAAKLDQAVRMRLNGAEFGVIAETIGVDVSSLNVGLARNDVDPEVLHRSAKRTEWTREQLLSAAALRHYGLSYEYIGAAFNTSASQVRRVLLDNAATLNLDPNHGKPTTLPAGPAELDDPELERNRRLMQAQRGGATPSADRPARSIQERPRAESFTPYPPGVNR